MSVSEVLYGAADHIDAFGHIKDRLYGDGPRESAPACVVGAICVVAGDEFTPGNDSTLAFAALWRHLSYGSPVDWNNAPERTAEEVVEALRAAALIEAAKETEPTRRIPGGHPSRILGAPTRPTPRASAVA